jgi:hypothetical protein
MFRRSRYRFHERELIMLKSRTRWFVSTVVTCGILIGTTALADKTVQKSEDDSTSEIVESLAMASELAAFGRGELADATGLKDLKSPEALIAAGGILLRIHKQTGGIAAPADASVVDADGKDVPEESGKTETLADEAEALFDEARALPSNDKAALEAQIKQAQTVTSRGGGMGPRVVTRVIKPGHAHTVKLAVKPHAAAVVAVQGTGKTRFEAIGPGGNVLWRSPGPRGIYNVHPGAGKGVTMKVINPVGPNVKYKVFAN